MLELGNIKKGSKIFFLGIGGISMSSLAQILKDKGFEVSGYDRAKSDMTTSLEEKGIKVYYDFDSNTALDSDVIIYSAAFGKSHEVFKAVKLLGKPMYSRAELLGAIASSYKNSIAVAGTHGKSTTSGMIGHTFMQSTGCDPTVVVGAVMREVGAAFRIGSDGNFIYEACEYCDSFLSFYPTISVVLNISLDHTDYFKDIEQTRESFVKFMNNGGSDSYSVYNLDCDNCVLAAKDYVGHGVTFSAKGDKKADYYASNIKYDNGYATFNVYRRGEFFVTLALETPGEHNISNALAATAVCDICGLTALDIKSGIDSYKGVGRRFEYKGDFRGARVYDDYAHHPEEIKATLSAARKLADGKVICVFQPHNYSRLRDLYGDFITAFTDADIVVLCPLYAAREKSGGEVSSQTLASEIDNAVYMESYDDITELLANKASVGDVILIMGAGNISAYAEKFTK